MRRHALSRIALAVVALASSRATAQTVAPAATPAGAAVASPAGCGSPQACFARMAAAQRSVGSLHARFRQVKTIALLKEPLVSTGELAYERPDRVRWEVKTPEPLVVDMSRGAMRAGPPGEEQVVDAGAAVRLFGDLAGLFTASEEYAASRFALEFGAAGEGSFVLTPRDPMVSQVIESIELDTDPALRLPRRAVIREPGGDRTEIELLDVEARPVTGAAPEPQSSGAAP